MRHASPAAVASDASASARVLQTVEAGDRAIGEGWHEYALDAFLSAAEMAPGVAAAWYGLGVASEALGQGDDAVRFLRKACFLSESTALYWRDLARAALGVEDVEAALASASKALALEPGNASALFVRARALASLERYPESIDAYGEIFARKPAPRPMQLSRISEYNRPARHRLPHRRCGDGSGWRG